jgi:tRNA(Ile)-lysidine synthase
MAARSGRYLRPLLGIRREQTRAACAALDLQPWEDPHNADPSFARARVRQDLLPAFEKTLGPGVAQALARTADLLRADTDVLDEMATAELERLGGIGTATAEGWPAEALAVLPIAIRHRMLRAAALAAGCPASALALQHVLGMDELITSWHGQRWTDLPGAIRCERRYGRLLFTAALRSEDQGGRE